MKKINVGVVGATGMVGQTFLEVLAEFEAETLLNIGELRLFASESSQGKKINYGKKAIQVGGIVDGCFDGLDFVFFSGGDDLSKQQAPKAVAAGAWVIDNSAAFRMHPDVPLVVPEVNGEALSRLRKHQIIANPNCSTIQLVVMLSPLLKSFGLERVNVATYQAASGAGREARDELVKQTQAKKDTLESEYFSVSLAYNVVPQIGSFGDDGFTSEEVKIMKETKKILRSSQLPVSACAVRVPVINGHSEVVWATFTKEATRAEVVECLKRAPGLVVAEEMDQVKGFTPKEVSGKNPVYVTRIHQDIDDPQTWLFWVVADNVRKGAATNGVQIATTILNR